MINQAVKEGQAREEVPTDEGKREEWVREKSWRPEYGEYFYVGEGK